MKRITFTSSGVFGLAYVLLFAALMLIALPHRGLFFAPEKVTSSTIIILVALVMGIVVTFYGPLRKKYKVPSFLWLMLAYATYAWLTTFWAANAELAVQGALIDTAAVAMAALVPLLTGLWRRALLSVIAFLGPLLYFFAMGAVFKFYTYTNAIQNNYMDSVFQYHNTFGAFSLAAAVIAAFLALDLRRWYSRAIYLASSTLSLVGVVVSYSRWVWILTAIMVVFSLVVAVLQRRLRDGFFSLLFSVLAALAASPFALVAMRHASKKQLVLAILISVVGAVIGALVIAGLRRVKAKWLQTGIAFLLVVIPIVLGVLLVQREGSKLASVVSRANTITFNDWSMRERFWFYGAASHMWEHNPIFGSGVGTWTAKFQAFQQFPYWSTMTHSVFFSQLIDFGLIGSLLWLGFIVLALYQAFRFILKRDQDSSLSSAGTLGGLAILLHSVFDFDMDFATVSFVALVLLAVSGSALEVPMEKTERAVALGGLTKRTWWLLVPGIATILIGYVGTMLGMSEIKVQAASRTTNADDKIAILQSAEHDAPYAVQPHLQLAELYLNNYNQSHATTDREQAWQESQFASKRGVWDPSVLQTTGTIAYQLGHIPEAYRWTKRSYEDGKLTPKYASTFMGIALWSGVIEASKNPTDAKVVFTSILDTYNGVQNDIQKMNHLPKGTQQLWKVSLDAPMQVYAATTEYALGHYQKSIDDMHQLSKSNRDTNTLGLFEMVALLDEARLNHQPTKNIPSQLHYSNATLLKEFQALETLNAK